MEYYPETERNELASHENTWRKLTCTFQSEGSPSEKGCKLYFQLCDVLGKGKLWRH